MKTCLDPRELNISNNSLNQQDNCGVIVSIAWNCTLTQPNKYVRASATSM